MKTHEYGPTAWSNFRKAVLLVRDPAKAIIAEFNRQSGGHVGFASIGEKYLFILLFLQEILLLIVNIS